MTFHLAAPGALVLLAIAPAFVWTARRRALGAGLCRAAAWTLLVVALAEPYAVRDRPARGVCVVAATDVSTSVGEAATAAARETVGRLEGALGPEDLIGAVAFAGRATVVAAPAAPERRPLATLLPASAPGVLEADETDLSAAVTAATALCPEGKQPAVLLFTDGNETAGHVVAEAALGDEPVPVFPVRPATTALPRVAMRRLLAPATTPAGLFVPLEAVVEARSPVTAAIALAVDDVAAPPRLWLARLRPGISVVALPYRATDVGPHGLAARVLTAPGEPPAIGVARGSLEIGRPVQVLWVSERDTTPVAALALVEHGVDVGVIGPSSLPEHAAHLAAVDVVVLDDVGHASVSDSTVRSVGRWVAGGGALVVTGGEHLFGDPGFVGGPLERLLPVDLVAQRPAPDEREPLALELVIDRSNSMGVSGPGGTRMDYARRAALAVLDQLAPTDLVGAVVFDEAATELAPPRPVGEARAALAAQIQKLHHGGGTDFLDALDIARRRLLAVPDHVRHVILLTDGDTNRRTAEHFPLIDDLVRGDVSVTTLRIGTDTASLELLTTIARATGGEFHHVERLETLPQVLIDDAQQRAASGGRHGARVHIVEGGPMLAGIAERDVPAVARWASTHPRPGAEVRLAVDAGTRRDPLLVTWGWELGRVAVVPLDFQAGGASWAVWRDFGKLWTQLVRWAAPGAGGDAPARRAGAAVPADVDDPGGVAREGRALGTNDALLESLAAATGGRVDPSPDDVLRARGGRARESRPVGTWLLPLVLVLVLSDVALRRPIFGRTGAARLDGTRSSR